MTLKLMCAGDNFVCFVTKTLLMIIPIFLPLVRCTVFIFYPACFPIFFSSFEYAYAILPWLLDVNEDTNNDDRKTSVHYISSVSDAGQGYSSYYRALALL